MNTNADSCRNILATSETSIKFISKPSSNSIFIIVFLSLASSMVQDIMLTSDK